jgi:hypothetical protein
MPGRMSCFSGIYNAKCDLILIVLVVVLVLERPLRTAEDEDKFEDEYD